MNENLNDPGQEKLKAWVKTQLDAAVWKLIDQGGVESLLVEAKPAWALPFQILIGKIRPRDEPKEFEWFICGEVPTDFLKSTAASNPREAARHFAMKWQLQAARRQDPAGQAPSEPGPEPSRDGPDNQLEDKAEELYTLVDDARLWLHKGSF
jgi:hypothetical protein